MNLASYMAAPWAIEPNKFKAVLEVYERHLSKEKMAFHPVVPQVIEDSRAYDVIGQTAVIQIEGVLGKKMNMLQEFSGGTSMQKIGSAFLMAVEDSSVDSIILNIDSPGGTLDGTQDLANLIYQSRGKKPIVAYVDGLAASAALWIASAADEVVASGPTAQIGSIGVVATHTDVSEQEKMLGVKTTEIVSSEFKRAASPYRPLDESGRAVIQEEVNKLHAIFVNDVAKFRGMDAHALNASAGNGLIFLGHDAVSVGLADKIGSFTNILAGLVSAEKHTGGRVMSENVQDEGVVIHTVEDLKAAFPDLCKELVALKNDEATLMAYAEGVSEERQRIQSIEAQAKGFPGHEKLIAEMKWDGKTTADQAAVRILNAERDMKSKHLQALEEESPEPVDVIADLDSMNESSDEQKHRLAEEYQKEHQCSVKDAYIQVSLKHPHLFK